MYKALVITSCHFEWCFFSTHHVIFPKIRTSPGLLKRRKWPMVSLKLGWRPIIKRSNRISRSDPLPQWMTAARGRNPAEELALQTTHAAETSGDRGCVASPVPGMHLCVNCAAWHSLSMGWPRAGMGITSCRVDTDPRDCLALCKSELRQF